MRLNELEKWGIPSRIIELWQARQGEMLLPIQDKVVRKGLIGKPYARVEYSPVSMLISAPTSSGKSFCAEMAAIKALIAREKTVMLFPLKSLAEQKYDLFKNTYGRLGVKCLVVTGDHPENDRAFADGHYQLAVAIYEKFDALLTASLDALKNIGLIVVDEIQTIGEPGRGAILERLLTKVRAADYRPGIVALSAVIGDENGSAGHLARWLGATLVEECNRPVELMRGVASDGVYQYRTYNEGLDGNEPFEQPDSLDNSFDAFVKQISSVQKSTLVFLKSRTDTVEAAFKLAASVKWPEAGQALAKLEGEEPSFLIRSLRQALTRGVAFHNSDLSSKQRLVVEQAFINKEVTVLFSTTTLAMGVNLAADVVYLETVKYTSGKYNHKPSLVPVSRSEFENMSGRAGRFQANGNNPGRAIIMAENEFDKDILWETYIASQNNESVKSAFETMPVEDWLLDMIVCGLLSSAEGESIDNVFSNSFHHQLYQQPLAGNTHTVLRHLVAEGLISINDETLEIKPTVLGCGVSKAGLSVRQAIHYRNKLRQGYPDTAAGWIALALSDSGWDTPPAMLSRAEQVQHIPVKMLYQAYNHLLNEASLLLGEKNPRHPLTYREAASLKALLLLTGWCCHIPVQDLEEQFQMHLGQIMNLGETTAHLVAAIAELVRIIDGSLRLPACLRQQAFSLRCGMPASLKPLNDHLGDILNRHDFAALSEAGVDSLQKLCELDDDTLLALIKMESKCKRIKDKTKQLKEELDMHMKWPVAESHHSPTMPSRVASLESIEIDGAYDRERYLVKINGFPIRLTGKSFKYFTKLAWSRVHRDSGWIYKEDIEVGFNQARYLYRMKGEISAGLNMSWPVIENNRLGYYRLNADPSRIRINTDNLKNHPDYEVRSLVVNPRAEPVN